MCHPIRKCQTGLWFLLRRHASSGESSAEKISDNKHGDKPRSQPHPPSIMRGYYQINEFTVGMLAADGRTLVGRLSGAGRVRFVFQACLSHFSCLVLEGRARICGFSDAGDRQPFRSGRGWARPAELARTSGCFSPQNATKGSRVSQGSLPSAFSSQL